MGDDEADGRRDGVVRRGLRSTVGRESTTFGSHPGDARGAVARVRAGGLGHRGPQQPVHPRGEQVVGAVNLYAADPHAFDGRMDALRVLIRTSTGPAAANADLSFGTRTEAQAAPGRCASAPSSTWPWSAAASRGVSIEQARELLDDAAARAQLDVPVLAETVLRTRSPLGEP